MATAAMRLDTAPEPGRARAAQERVYRELREAIVTGRFVPGRPVTLRGVAVELGVSPMPVREALRQLVAERALVDVRQPAGRRAGHVRLALRRAVPGPGAARARARHAGAAAHDRGRCRCHGGDSTPTSTARSPVATPRPTCGRTTPSTSGSTVQPAPAVLLPLVEFPVAAGRPVPAHGRRSPRHRQCRRPAPGGGAGDPRAATRPPCARRSGPTSWTVRRSSAATSSRRSGADPAVGDRPSRRRRTRRRWRSRAGPRGSAIRGATGHRARSAAPSTRTASISPSGAVASTARPGASRSMPWAWIELTSAMGTPAIRAAGRPPPAGRRAPRRTADDAGHPWARDGPSGRAARAPAGAGCRPGPH